MNYCKYMQRDSRFLDYAPSLIAAASLIATINITQSTVTGLIKIKYISESKMRHKLNKALSKLGLGMVSKVKVDPNPLRMWNNSI